MTQYCAGKSKVVINYRFSGEGEKRVEFNRPPLDVVEIVGNTSGIVDVPFYFSFDGTIEGRVYQFVVTADVPVTSNIYLLEGLWDDWGGIGSYSSGYQLMARYQGEPLLVGRGNRVNGMVVNERIPICDVRGIVRFEVGEQSDAIEVYRGSSRIYQDTGDKLLYCRVSCDDDCPAGYCKCITTKYPGYCCLSCKDIAAKINSLSQRCHCG